MEMLAAAARCAAARSGEPVTTFLSESRFHRQRGHAVREQNDMPNGSRMIIASDRRRVRQRLHRQINCSGDIGSPEGALAGYRVQSRFDGNGIVVEVGQTCLGRKNGAVRLAAVGGIFGVVAGKFHQTETNVICVGKGVCQSSAGLHLCLKDGVVVPIAVKIETCSSSGAGRSIEDENNVV